MSSCTPSLALPLQGCLEQRSSSCVLLLAARHQQGASSTSPPQQQQQPQCKRAPCRQQAGSPGRSARAPAGPSRPLSRPGRPASPGAGSCGRGQGRRQWRAGAGASGWQQSVGAAGRAPVEAAWPDRRQHNYCRPSSIVLACRACQPPSPRRTGRAWPWAAAARRRRRARGRPPAPACGATGAQPGTRPPGAPPAPWAAGPAPSPQRRRWRKSCRRCPPRAGGRPPAGPAARSAAPPAARRAAPPPAGAPPRRTPTPPCLGVGGVGRGPGSGGLARRVVQPVLASVGKPHARLRSKGPPAAHQTAPPPCCRP